MMRNLEEEVALMWGRHGSGMNPADWSYVEDDGSTWTTEPEPEPVPSGRWFLAGVLLVIAAVVLYALVKETAQ